MAVGAPALVPLAAANPFNGKRFFELQVGPADERRAHLVARQFATERSGVRALLRLLDREGRAVSDGAEQIRASFELGPLARRELQLLIELPNDLHPGTSAVIEAELLDTRHEGLLAGSLGVVLLSPSD